MFEGCSGLTSAPALPATTLSQNCYKYMFYKCSGLTKPADISHVTTVAQYCCSNMYNRCTGIKMYADNTTSGYKLGWATPASTSASYWSSSMFYSCGSDNCCSSTDPTANTTYYILGEPPSTTYNVLYNLNDGSGTAPTSLSGIKVGDSITLPNNTGFSKTGYEFLGWSTASNAVAGYSGSYTIRTIDVVNDTITFYAIWELEKYLNEFEIYIDDITGAVEIDDINVSLSDSNLSVDGLFLVKYFPGDTPEDDEYEFCSDIDEAGIYIIVIVVKENSGKWFPADDTHTSSETAYARAITIDGDFIEGYVSATANYVSPTLDNYISSSNDKYLNVLLEIPYIIEVENRTISFAGGEDTSGTAPSSQNQIEGKTITLPANTFTKTDYNFCGWSDGTKTYQAGTTYTVGANDITLTAVWDTAQGGDTLPNTGIYFNLVNMCIAGGAMLVSVCALAVLFIKRKKFFN